jgi:hypothetical protein
VGITAGHLMIIISNFCLSRGRFTLLDLLMPRRLTGRRKGVAIHSSPFAGLPIPLRSSKEEEG